ncbi:putative nuclease HARBI1 [Prorops nasuta]|uniref:putative nuclease HARBI1 n=1 Tax=Prorops nasuta TaxID=863751 RepID=UPI0034CEE42E
MRQAISCEMRLSATLRFLATGHSFKDLAFSTRIAHNTLSQIIPETLEPIVTKLEEQQVIQFPKKSEDWLNIANKFMNLWHFPNCIGACDGKNIAFHPPRSEGSKLRNYKVTDSLVLLALVDAEYKFIFVDVGKNGRCHDSSVFLESSLGKSLKENKLNLPEPSALPGSDYKMPNVIIADDAFALHPNLMKPYPERGLTQE